MNLQTPKYTKLLNFFFLNFWLMSSFGAMLISLFWFGVDFRGYYAATQVLLTGGNPYDYHQVAEVLLQVTGKMGNNPYYYPPWFTWIFIPLAKLPFQTARAIWLILNLLIWNISIAQISRLVDWPVNGWKRYAIFTLSTLTFAWITFRYEQAGILILGMFVAFMFAYKKQKLTQAGVWLALSLTKPNITFIVVFGICLWLIRMKQWRPIFIMAATLVTLLTISTILTPDWFKPFLEPNFGNGLTTTLDGPEIAGKTRVVTTMLDWLAYLGIRPEISRFLYSITIAFSIPAFFLAVLRSQSLLEVTSLSILISCAITPYILQYDYPPLVITFLWALSLLTPASWLNILFAGFIFYASMWDASIASRYWVIVGLIALATCALYFKNRQKSQNQDEADFSESPPPH